MWLQILLIAGLVAIHLFASRMLLLESVPRSSWLSFAGGVAVGYVFLHLFPEIGEARERINAAGSIELFAGHHIYLVALAGLVLFYGLERFVRAHRPSRRHSRPGNTTSSGDRAFWMHMVFFSFYNALIGYLLLHRVEDNARSLLLYFLAMSLHFLVNDFGLRTEHKNVYRLYGRWILSTALATGWAIGLFTEVDELAVDIMFAFLAGGIVLNVLKEELPEERQSRFLPFLLGVACYGLVSLI